MGEAEIDLARTDRSWKEARERDMALLRDDVRRSRHTYGDIASACGKSAGWVGTVLRGDYPYAGGNWLPKNVRLALERFGFTVPCSLVTW